MIRRSAETILPLSLILLLIVLAVRAVMTSLFLNIEYQRVGFPADPYGLTTAQRLEYAPLALDFLIEGRPVHFLEELAFPDGSALFNIRELGHMADVQRVAQDSFKLAWAIAAIAIICSAFLYLRDPAALKRALRASGLGALGMIAMVVISAIVAWDSFFTAFHGLLFASGTWVFNYSDTLIRLFPEQFWFDAALTVGALIVLGSLLLLACAWALGRFKHV